jgi:hypothetical protein
VKRPRCVVLESPYGNEDPLVVAENIRYLKACLADCLARGESPYASHGLLTRSGVLNDRAPEQRALGLAAAQAWIRRAEGMVVYTDRGISGGMQAAVGVATDEMVPIEYRKLGAPWSIQ